MRPESFDAITESITRRSFGISSLALAAGALLGLSGFEGAEAGRDRRRRRRRNRKPAPVYNFTTIIEDAGESCPNGEFCGEGLACNEGVCCPSPTICEFIPQGRCGNHHVAGCPNRVFCGCSVGQTCDETQGDQAYSGACVGCPTVDDCPTTPGTSASVILTRGCASVACPAIPEVEEPELLTESAA